MKLLIAGEGKDELGRWAIEEPHRSRQNDIGDGLIEAFLRRIRPDGWSVVDARFWKRIPKYVARRGSQDNRPTLSDTRGKHLGAEGHTVLGLALLAEEKGYDALVFVRDRDRDEGRADDIETALTLARERFAPRIAGGVAIEEVESWVLSLLNHKDAERHGSAKEVLEERHHITTLDGKRAVVASSDLARVREDARSLRLWLDRVREALDVRDEPG
ncbi:hypothetical protein [Polyangium sp. 15x6]|uniref:hypothetical protein n=1 Tax=Polyangium sp. 15x6 TaxID=3042687 RepID=UPI00249B35C9|nr:hypothetical protein [Polyangium sp. 15x6]MDI3283805.1 hypothetical protein [Polyangium sp. 15x6]